MKVSSNLKVITVLTAVISTINSVTVSADTLNDIRQRYGLLRSDNSKFVAQATNIEKQFNEIEDSNRTANYVNSFGLKESYKNDYETSEKKYNDKVTEMTNSFKGCASVQTVFNLYAQKNELYEVKEGNRKKYENIKDLEAQDNLYVNDMNYINYMRESSSDTQDYGQLGKYLECIIKHKDFIIELPFGSYVDADGVEKRNNGLYIKTNTQDTDTVITPLAGEVSGIRKDDETGTYVITIKHGEYIKTHYWYISSPTVSIGDKLNQYDSIGTINSDIKHIYMDVELDGNRVNPLTLWGETGDKLLKYFMEDNANSSLDIKPDRVVFDNINANDVHVNLDSDSSVDGQVLLGYDRDKLEQEKEQTSGMVDSNLDLVPKEVRDRETESDSETTSVNKENGNRVYDLNGE